MITNILLLLCGLAYAGPVEVYGDRTTDTTVQSRVQVTPTGEMRVNVNGSTVAIHAVTGSPLEVTCISGCSGSASGATTVTPGTGTWSVNGSTLAIVNPDGATLAVTVANGSLAVTGPLTDAQLRAVAVPVSGTFWQATQPISAAALPLPSGAATEAGNLATIAAKDFSTETTLSALNAKVTAVNTGAVTISAALPAGTNNIGDVDVLTLPALPTGSNVIGAVTQSGTWNVGSITTLPSLVAGTANIGTVNGSTVAVVGPNGAPIIVTPSTATLKSAAFSISATGTVIAAVASKRLKVYALAYISGGIASVNFRDGGSTLIESPFAHVANSGRVENVNPPAFLFATTAGNSLDMVYSGAGTVAGRISYWEE